MVNQPVLVEGAYTDLEQLFIEEQPKNLWPPNQHSNLGAIRKVLTGNLQGALTTAGELGFERFVETSQDDGYLGRWEAEVGLPVAPAARSEADRRALVLGRLRKGPFQRSRVREIMEAHISATFGSPTELTPAGVPITAAGITMFGEGGPVETLYRIYEDIRNFSYEVRVNNTIVVDTVSLLRELRRLTPAWINFTVDNVGATILDYSKAVKSLQPAWYSRLAGNANDDSGYVNNGTLNGTPAALASPGLLVNPAGGSSPAYDFDGVNDFISVPHAAHMAVGDNMSLEIWFRLDATPGAGTEYSIFHKAGSYYVGVDSSRRVFFTTDTGTSILRSNALVQGTIYHLVIRKSPTQRSIRVNNVENVETDYAIPIELVNNSNPLRIGAYNGSSSFFNGPIDEPALYDRYISNEAVTEHYNTGRNVA